MLPKPPNRLVFIDTDLRSEILENLLIGNHISILWREKVRSFVSFHRRYLGRECYKRFGDEKKEFLIWMFNLLTLEEKGSQTPDYANLNAAIFVNDVLDDQGFKLVIEKKIKILETWLKELPQSSKSNFDIIGDTFSPIEKIWHQEALKAPPVTIICPSSKSLYSLSVMALCMKFGIKVEAVIVKRLSLKRFKQEWRRDGVRLLRKIWRKLILMSDENSDLCRVSLRVIYQRLQCGFNDVNKFANDIGASLFLVEDLKNFPSKNCCGSFSTALFTGGGLVGENFLNRFSNGVINVHLGCLPKYRGMDVVQAPILEGHFTSVGVTAHKMVKGLDEGPVISHFKVNADEYETLGELRNELSALTPLMCFDAFLGTTSGRYETSPQRKQDGRQYYIVHKALDRVIKYVLKHRYTKQKSPSIINIVNKLVGL